MTEVTQPRRQNISELLKSKKRYKQSIALLVASRAAAKRWWSQAGSNRRPPECKSGALPSELWPPGLSFFRLDAFRFDSTRLRTDMYAPSLHRNETRPAKKNPEPELQRDQCEQKRVNVELVGKYTKVHIFV